MTIWFTADLHFGHQNIIRYCNRPWDTSDEMDAALINNWNEKIKKGDLVYVVGDIGMGHVDEIVDKVNQLNGQKHLVIGNHDKGYSKKPRFKDLWQSMSYIKTAHAPDPDAPSGTRRMVLCHYAMRVWNLSHRDTWHLYGHSHGTLWDDPKLLSTDVGVDAWDYKPISYAQVKRYIESKKKWESIDYHKAHRR